MPASAPLTSRAGALKILIVPLLAAAVLTFSLSASPEKEPPAAGQHAVSLPFLQPQPVVVAADRMVCSLLGRTQTQAGIVGADGSDTVVVGGVVYWSFGDTVLSGGAMIPNSVARSADHDASDCVSLQPSERVGRAVPLLPANPGEELTVWPLGMEETAPGRVHFYYASVVSDPQRSWRVAGVGVASFDTTTLAAQRAMGGKLVWPESLPLPSRTLSDGQYVYILLDTSPSLWNTDTFLARVPKESMESPGSYEYWQPGRGGQPGRWLAGLWDEGAGRWKSGLPEIGALWTQPALLNGADVAYNPYLKRWLAVYTTGFMTSVNLRSAAEISGPWDGPEAVLVRCPGYHPAPPEGFVCYSGAQHAVYARDGGRTIYVSYSNGDSYQVYLHEIHLAGAVTRWSDQRGRAVYLTDGATAPEGFVSDGLAFYASDIPVPGFAPIHAWGQAETGSIRYGAAPPYPQEAYRDLGIGFYAPASASRAETAHAMYAPVYRWSRGEQERYSPLDLRPAGYAPHETSFYAPCPDADNDGLTDCLESFLGTSPSLADTDGDYLNDGYERSTPACDPLAYNDDGDAVSWLEEMTSGGNPCINDAA